MLAADRPLSWRKVSAEGLDVDYCRLLERAQADRLLEELERVVDYFTGELAQVFVFGKWHDIPRQQVFLSRLTRRSAKSCVLNVSNR